MHVSGKFDNKTITISEKEKRNQELHIRANNAFKLSKNIKKSVDPAKMLNAVLTNESIFSFSFVRHPYTR